MFKTILFSKQAVIKKILILFLTAAVLCAACGTKRKTEPKKTMKDFGIRASNLFLYYEDLERASVFYTETLGIQLTADYGMAKILRVAADAYLILVDASKGMHSADEPKTVAIALITDQLDEWHDYLTKAGVELKYPYKKKEGRPHDGFVVLDPAGYYLEFERFNEHPENGKFIPILSRNRTLLPGPGQKTTVPSGLGFKSMITWLYYKDLPAMQRFYEDVLGLEMVVDQGWTKIYQVSSTGFTGLVDEKKGMHSFTETKAVNVSFIIDDIENWFAYTRERRPFELRSKELETGPENKYRAFVGYDPEGYYMEFDKFYEHPANDKLIKHLQKEENSHSDDHLGGCILTAPTGPVPGDLYGESDIVPTDEYKPFTKKLTVCGITLIGRDDISDEFMKKVAAVVKAMFPRGGGIDAGLQEEVLKNLYQYRAVIPLFKGEEQEFSPADRKLWCETTRRNSICDIIMEGVPGQVNEVVEHILHYVTDIGLHYALPADWGISKTSQVYRVMREAIDKKYYDVGQYDEIPEPERNRVLLQEYAYWTIYCAWDLREPFGPHEAEYSIMSAKELKAKLPASYELFDRTIPKIMTAPSRSMLEKFLPPALPPVTW